jgi:chromosome partitioning protein
MTMVYTVAQQKGGAGKTTLAANLAAAFAANARTRRVAILDIDPQRSLARWYAIRQARKKPPVSITFSDISGWRLPAELERLKRDHDVVLIDSPPVVDTDARLAVRGADLLLLPVQPSPPDLWAVEGTLRLATAERRRSVIVLNRSPASSRLRDAVVADVAARGLVLLPTALGNRMAFAAAFAEGLGVTEAAPRSVAAAEIFSLLSDIEGASA